MTSPSPAEFLASSSRAVNGSSPWASRYAADIKRAWTEHASEDTRTVQRHLGPSELGVECDRQVAGKMAELPTTNHVVDPWPSTRGRALHTHAEDVFTSDNRRNGLARWLTETRVTPHPEHPGTSDLYDALEQSVVDHKFLGKTSLTKLRKITSTGDWAVRAATWPRVYLVQLLLYGLGFWLKGLPVRRVVIVGYPATEASLDGMYVADIDFADEHNQLLPEVRALIEEVFADTARRKTYAEQILARQIQLLDVPAVPSSDECFFCPFYRPQSAKDNGPGCPGTVATAAY